MLLTIGTEQDVDVQVVPYKRRPGKHLACCECGFKVWTSERTTAVVCAACLHELSVRSTARS